MRQMWAQKYGSFSPRVYDGHNEDVKKIIPKDQLLVYDVREGWEPLCKFLEVPVPAEPFPNLNDTQAMRAIYWGMMAFGLSYWALYMSAAAGVGYLALYPTVAEHLVQHSVKWVINMGAKFGLR